MNLVSIIIPMYNEVLNIGNCVNVLRNQKNQDFDVFLLMMVRKMEQLKSFRKALL